MARIAVCVYICSFALVTCSEKLKLVSLTGRLGMKRFRYQSLNGILPRSVEGIYSTYCSVAAGEHGLYSVSFTGR